MRSTKSREQSLSKSMSACVSTSALECLQVRRFVQERPDLWNEDIGLPPATAAATQAASA